MSKAYLTIDDVTSNRTKIIVDGLIERGIWPLMFATGKCLEEHWDEGIYALKRGIILGNHSFSHPHFSELSLEESIQEIDEQEFLLEKLYLEANVQRTYKVFRFPYGDQGGDKKERLQAYLKNLGFCKLDDRMIQKPWYAEKGFYKDLDAYWTFDFTEYLLPKDSSYTIEDCKKRIHNQDALDGDYLLEDCGMGIVLIHDHPQTEAVAANYFFELVDYAISNGVEFVAPKFIEI